MSDMPDLSNLSDHAEQNRTRWNSHADDYQTAHGPQLEESGGTAWGGWQIPESELGILGDVAGRDVLELGCGAAQWSIALAKQGARPVGLDLSERQLEHARQAMDAEGLDFPLVHASAEHVPLPDDSFDIVFCDHGAMSFCDPYLAVPEAARLLRSGGLFAFCTVTPFVDLCWPMDAETISDRLQENYFEIYRSEGGDGEVVFNLPYGAWLRLFHAHDLEVIDLVELRPGENATSTYWDDTMREWARNWPFEMIWRLRRKG